LAAAVPAFFVSKTAAALLAASFAGSMLFFRDPERDPEGPGVVSPADGVVTRAEGLGDGSSEVSIFMRLRDVHVNRVPLGGTVEDVGHQPGRFRPAFGDTSLNERNTVTLDTEEGFFEVQQVAGFFARRIRCFLEPGDEVARGERLGIIAFSSRVNVVLPFPAGELEVSVGDTVKAGETLLIRQS